MIGSRLAAPSCSQTDNMDREGICIPAPRVKGAILIDACRDGASLPIRDLAVCTITTRSTVQREFLRSTRDFLAERVGFEPTVEFPLHTLSKRAP